MKIIEVIWKVISGIYRIPMLPFLFVFMFIMILRNTPYAELMIRSESDEPLFDEEFIKNFDEKYGIYVNIFNMIIWFIIYILFIK